MMNFFSFMCTQGEKYSNNIDFSKLSKEEKTYINFVDNCLQSDNGKLSNACFQIMTLVITLKDNPDMYQPEEIHNELSKIKVNLNEEERIITNNFMIAFVKSLSVYDKEKVQRKRLIRERKK